MNDDSIEGEMKQARAGASGGVVKPCGCACGGAPDGAEPSYVYALGRIEARFPSPGIEKEFAQVVARSGTAGIRDGELVAAILGKRENRYLARRMCWVMSIEGLDTYLLQPSDPADVDLLVEAVRGAARPGDVDVVIGVRGPVAPPSYCNGLQVPIVRFDQLYSFDVATLISAIPLPEGMTEEAFRPSAEELFWRIMQLADNAGATGEHRALNYLAVRYPAIYAAAAAAHARNASLASVDVRPSRLSGVREVVDVVLTFVNRATDVADKLFVRVDVTEEYPFLVTKLSPYFDR